MTLSEFIAKWNGKGIDFDGAYGNQCMDLMHQYHVDVLGIADGRTLAAPAAKDVWNNFSSMFNKDKFEAIPNTETAVPEPGDIMLWTNNTYGHVSIFVSGNVNEFTSFDQNFPINTKCHLQKHQNYAGVAGWLRFKKPIVLPPTSNTDFNKAIDYLEEYRAVRTTDNGAEGSFEGFSRAIIENDRRTPSLKVDLSSARNELETTKVKLTIKDEAFESLKKQLDLAQKALEAAEKPQVVVSEPVFKNPVAAWFYKMAKWSE